MSNPVFFDAFTEIGPRENKPVQLPWKLSELLAEMEHCSISGALVSHTQSVRYDAMRGNLELSAALKPQDHLFPIWNVLPHQTGEFPEPRQLEPLLRRHNVRAVTIYPKTNAWDWSASHSQVLLRWLERRCMLTILKRSEFGSYSELDQFLSKHRQLPVLLVSATWADQRYILPLVQKYRNLHITFDWLQINYGIEDLVAAGCENQLVYASTAPGMAIGPHRAYVDYADVPVKIRAKIAGGNLSRLLKGLTLPRERINQNEDRLMAAARRGDPQPVPVIDMHMHILDEGLNGAGGHFRMSHGGPAGTFHRLQKLGCVGGGFMSWNGPISCDSVAGNRCVADALDVAPPGYFGLATFDTKHYSQDELRKLIPATYQDKRFIGMKPYITHGIEYFHKSYDVWWECGNKLGLYAGIHRNRLDFSEVDVLAKKYPRVRWVPYHCGMRYDVADAAIECIKKHKNVYAEITYTSVPGGVLEHLVEQAGADRVVYGSDLPMRDPRQQLGWVVYSRLTAAQKEQVLWRNALAVIGPCWQRLPKYNRPVVPTR